jgi:hypothetical protein
MKRTSWILLFIVLTPIIGMIDIYVVSTLLEFIRMPSDLFVMIGFGSTGFFIVLHYFLFKFIIKKTTTQ